MNAREAAELTSLLQPTVTIPHHYAFHSGRLGSQMITKGERDPLRFVRAAAEIAPTATVHVALPGERVTIP
jgi:L-ascorbate metabolism protein UlaG (beta-lactamase superfamily)